MDKIKTVKSSKSMNVLMNTIDLVLEEIVWVNKKSEIVNLKQILSNKSYCSSNGCIEELPYDDLVGAYTCLQIRCDMFDENIKYKNSKEISEKIKEMIFYEARNKLINAGLCKIDNKGQLICKTKKIAV